MTITREAILPAPPSVNETYRNATAIEIARGSRGRRKTGVYTSWIKSAGIVLNAARLGTFNESVAVLIRVGKCNRARDLDNFGKGAMDLLVACGVIRTDNMTCVHGVHIVCADYTIPDGFVGISVSPSISVEVGA